MFLENVALKKVLSQKHFLSFHHKISLTTLLLEGNWFQKEFDVSILDFQIEFWCRIILAQELFCNFPQNWGIFKSSGHTDNNEFVLEKAV